ncbi:MAG: hypothetical protein M1831_005387 [Alyxoria varia]|nr:MAG: hypothetical protein M1831_005387 [Alyxoria varia]
MAQSPVFNSEYLQNRFNEKKAESARANNQAGHPRRRLTSGRDDGIFDNLDDSYAPGRKPSDKMYASSPINPISRRGSQNRKASNLGAGASSAPRAMGVREMEDHVDKLSKQNFDLKLELYHRREKIEELERKIQELAGLETDNAELLEVNDELVSELDKRDRAVDEAVAMICDLEEKVQELQEEANSRTPPTAKQNRNLAGNADRPAVFLQSPPAGRRHRSPSTGDVDVRSNERSDVSLRDSNNAGHSEAPTRSRGRRARHVPSFIDSGNNTTDALRSMYMDGDKMIRPIPSFASIASNEEVNQDDVDLDEPPQSPQLSAISDSELKSMYGQEDPISYEESTGAEPREPSIAPSVNSSHSSRVRRARTDRWVSDRAVSPNDSQKSSKASSHRLSRFQSLDNVLQDPPHKKDPVPHRKAPPHRNTRVKDATPTPPMHGNPLFNQNVFPPTPDTMITHPSNQSSTSIIQEKSLLDTTPGQSKGFAPFLSSTGVVGIPGTHPGADTGSRNSLLPQDFDAYGGTESGDDRGQYASQESFGPPLYASDRNRPTSSKSGKSAARVRSFGSSLSDSHEDARAPQKWPLRSSPTPPRLFNSRRRSIEHDPDKPPAGVENQLERVNSDSEATRTQSKRHSMGTTPTQAAFPHTRSRSPQPSHTPASVLATPRRKPPSSYSPHIAYLSTSRPPEFTGASTQTPQNPPTLDGSPETSSTSRAPKPTASLRARVAQLARRSSSSASNTDISNPVQAKTPKSESGTSETEIRHQRSESLSRRTRNLFHRRNRSGSSGGALSPKSASAWAAAQPAVLGAAKAASPYLNVDTPTNSTGSANTNTISRAATLPPNAQSAAPSPNVKTSRGRSGVATGIPFVADAKKQRERETTTPSPWPSSTKSTSSYPDESRALSASRTSTTLSAGAPSNSSEPSSIQGKYSGHGASTDVVGGRLSSRKGGPGGPSGTGMGGAGTGNRYGDEHW